MSTRRAFLGAAASIWSAPWRALASDVQALGYFLFDGHAHLVANDQSHYPRAGAGNPPPGAAGGLPPGVGGQAGGSATWTVRADMDADQVIPWMDMAHVVRLAAVQKKGTYGYDNSYILDSADRFPTRLAPVVVLDAEDPKTPDQVRAWVRDRGLAGVRLTGPVGPDKRLSWLNSPRALRTWKAMAENGLVADIMITAMDRPPVAITSLIDLALQFPSVRIVVDHLAYPVLTAGGDYGIDSLHASLSRPGNVFMKITSINLDLLREAKVSAGDFLKRMVDVYGAEHVLWGTDAGNSAGSYPQLVGRMVDISAALGSTERRQVLHDTGDAVFVRGGKRK